MDSGFWKNLSIGQMIVLQTLCLVFSEIVCPMDPHTMFLEQAGYAKRLLETRDAEEMADMLLVCGMGQKNWTVV